MKTIKVGELVFDFNLYPRVDVDSQHCGYIAEAIQSGNQMPPIVICQSSKRIVDGFHRGRAYLRLFGPDHEIGVVAKRYKSEGELLADAMRYNAHHGRTLTRYDRVHCLLLAEKLELSIDETASALGMTVEKLAEMRTARVGKLTIPGKRTEQIPLKRTIGHMAGRPMSRQQGEVNERLGGMNQLFYVNQIIMLLESDLIDHANAGLLERLQHLGGLIAGLSAKAA